MLAAIYLALDRRPRRPARVGLTRSWSECIELAGDDGFALEATLNGDGSIAFTSPLRDAADRIGRDWIDISDGDLRPASIPLPERTATLALRIGRDRTRVAGIGDQIAADAFVDVRLGEMVAMPRSAGRQAPHTRRMQTKDEIPAELGAVIEVRPAESPFGRSVTIVARRVGRGAYAWALSSEGGPECLWRSDPAMQAMADESGFRIIATGAARPGPACRLPATPACGHGGFR